MAGLDDRHGPENLIIITGIRNLVKSRIINDGVIVYLQV
jgi:hypothetical protein